VISEVPTKRLSSDETHFLLARSSAATKGIYAFDSGACKEVTMKAIAKTKAQQSARVSGFTFVFLVCVLGVLLSLGLALKGVDVSAWVIG
jgi:hypothetical protein